MKLFPPQDKDFQIYRSAFGSDLLGRSEAGRRLSELLEKVDDPLVVALDGHWGSGKSYFLKRWVGAHNLENNGAATTIYFDAFASDFLDDPIVALTGAIDDRLPKEEKSHGWKKAKRAVVRLAKPLLRIGIATATAGASEVAGPIVDAAVEAAGEQAEEAADAFWKREDGRKAAMKQFREGLTQLTAPSNEGKSEKPLVVVIDELDRCRPDYALSMLEVIKHFFSVPHVHFVLGVNLEAIEHSVRARYGAEVNARDYLKRFISVTMQLPEFVPGPMPKRAVITYFERCAADMEIDQNQRDMLLHPLKFASSAGQVSLRDVEKILTRLALLPERRRLETLLPGWKILIASLLLFQVLDPDIYRMAMKGSLTIEQIRRFYGITSEMITKVPERSQKFDHTAYILAGCWSFVISNGSEPKDENGLFARAFDGFGDYRTASILPEIQRDFFGLFSVQD